MADLLLPPAPGLSPDWAALEAGLSWLAALPGSPQAPIHHAEGCVLTHTRLVVEALLADPDWHALPEDVQGILYAAALLHDVAKPETMRLEEGGGGSPTAATPARARSRRGGSCGMPAGRPRASKPSAPSSPSTRSPSGSSAGRRPTSAACSPRAPSSPACAPSTCSRAPTRAAAPAPTRTTSCCAPTSSAPSERRCSAPRPAPIYSPPTMPGYATSATPSSCTPGMRRPTVSTRPSRSRS